MFFQTQSQFQATFQLIEDRHSIPLHKSSTVIHRNKTPQITNLLEKGLISIGILGDFGEHSIFGFSKSVPLFSPRPNLKKQDKLQQEVIIPQRTTDYCK